MNEYQRARGYPCDSQEWFFKILGEPKYKHIWAPAKQKEETMLHCIHTEHATRADGRYGRHFEINADVGTWELCYTQTAPTTCRYCDGEGNSSAGGPCGFCAEGKPLDTAEDWDNSWGGFFERFEKRYLEKKIKDIRLEEKLDKS